MGAEGEDSDRLALSVVPVGGEAHVTAEGLRLCTELSVSARAFRPYTVSIPVSATYVEDVTPTDETTVTVYYPTDGDTLWSVGKAYAVPLSALRKQNGLPEDGEPDPADATSLDGYAYLITGTL